MVRDIHKQTKILTKAQEIYGYSNQIAVAMEELAELTAVLAKYPRFDSHSDAIQNKEYVEKVIDECADVCVVLQHVYMIFGITDDMVGSRMDKKIERLERWLNTNDKMSQTMIDREVAATSETEEGSYVVKDCHTCEYEKEAMDRPPCSICGHDRKPLKWLPKQPADMYRRCKFCDSYKSRERCKDCDNRLSLFRPSHLNCNNCARPVSVCQECKDKNLFHQR